MVGSEGSDALWNDIGSLAKLLAASFYNLKDPAQTQQLVPELCHAISMLAGVGSLPIRSAVAGLLVNFVQSLLVANSSNKSKATQLKSLLERCSGEEVLRALGLARLATQSDDYGLLENIDESDSLEEIGQVLLDAIRLGSPDPGT